LASLRQEKNPPSYQDYFQHSLKDQYIVRVLPAAPLRLFSVYQQTGKHAGLFATTKLHRINDKYVRCCSDSAGITCDVNFAKLGSETPECPICEYYKYLWEQTNRIQNWNAREDIIREARELRAVKRFYYNVVDRETGEVKIWAVGNSVHEQLVKLAENFNYTDVDEGCDLHVTRRSIAHIFQYDVRPLPSSPLARTKEEIEKIIANQWELQRIIEPTCKLDLEKEVLKHKLRRQPRCQGCGQPFEMQFPGQQWCSPKCWMNSVAPDEIEAWLRTCDRLTGRAVASTG
jgi:hypothetical protein